MASWGMLGAGLSAMGDTLGKYAMQRISSDEALAREKQLADYKIEMAEKADARAAESYAKKVGGARTAATTALQGRIAEQTRLPGLLSLQSQSEAAWEDNIPTSAPVIRSGEVTEETALRDLSAKDRDIYRRNVAENIEYAQGLKPSTSQVEAETLRVLMDSSPKEAKQYLEMLNTKSDIEKRLRGETGKFEFRTVGNELVAIDPTTGETAVIHHGKKTGAGAKPSADEIKTTKAVDRLNRIRVHDTSGAVRQMTRGEFGELAKWASVKPEAGTDTLKNAPQWVRDTIQEIGGQEALRELLKEAGPGTLTFHAPRKPAAESTQSRGSASTAKPLDLNKYRTIK